ncbi:alpha-N-acetylgalactosaminide alpha-2,6-sialyltransferase 2-like [Patiria miniata]|uniref:alpha-N-acetylgalactosaminide alpha-2,6-sialyltransferase n=1 Tax=Patiria miniata TaxID=46514 RepID=A0A913Z933_PATMI|nr:alpha-N-acetylgalactosaminide alpha-2,6-sialyltransferase 2-like [Patiria miniata]
MPSMRSKIARSRRIKAALAGGVLLYGVILLVSTSTKQEHHMAYPWAAQGDGFRQAHRQEHLRHTMEIEANSQSPAGRRGNASRLLIGNHTNSLSPAGSRGNQSQQLKGNHTVVELNKITEEPLKCTRTLKSLTKYSKWFQGRYQPKVKLFLDKNDINNYKSYLTRGLPYGFKGQNHTEFDLVLKNPNFTNPSIHGAHRKAGCIRCAVVGSGGILNGSGAGAEIDGHDYVFRVNRALSRGRFATDVGRRTTFYTFFPESQGIGNVEDKSMIAFYAMFKAYDVAYAKKLIQGDKSPRYNITATSRGMKRPGLEASKLKIIHPAFFNYVSQVYLMRKARPTTGSIVVIMSLHICDEVTIYGFGYDPRFTMHYYDSKFIKHTQKSTASHNVDNERKLWMKLHEEGVIRLFKRDL